MQATDDEIDYLLSGGGMSGEQRDRIRARLLAEARPRAHRRGRAAFVLGAVGSVAAAAALLLVPRAMNDTEAMRAKGAGNASVGSAVSAPPPSLQVACLGGTLSACPRGSLLGFSVRGSELPGFVTAFADPIDGAGERIWYFSDQPLASAHALAGGDTRVLAAGARVGPEHSARRYRIQLLLARQPLGRGRAAANPSAPDVVARAVLELEVLP
jgi:hypothetical protein